MPYAKDIDEHFEKYKAYDKILKDIVENAFVTIEAQEGKFILQNKYECSSISEVLEKLCLIENV